MTGTLYVVATPIGNLEDITLRAIRILRECDVIASEDTRQTRKLLDHHAIAKPLVSYHEHNELSRAEELVRELEAGKNIALVSDAGTPLIADPGYRLVRKALERGIVVTPIPGPSALIAALCASGLPTDSFLFLGFLPPKKGRRQKLLDEWKNAQVTIVCYEAPHRVLETLDDIAEVMGSRPIAIARELTKIHEEFLFGAAVELRQTLAARTIRGEFVLMIGAGETAVMDETPLEEAVDKLIESGLPRMEAIKTVARDRGLSKREAYKRFHVPE